MENDLTKAMYKTALRMDKVRIKGQKVVNAKVLGTGVPTKVA